MRKPKPRDEHGVIIPDGKTIKDPFIEPYHITVDEYGYSIYETIKPETSGKQMIYIKPVGHYSNFVNCLEKLAKFKLNDESYTSIKDYITKYEQIKNEIKQTITL